MARYKSSIEALQQLLHLGRPDSNISDKRNSNVMHCHITKASKGVTYAKDETGYYFVEVTCSNGTQHGLQAYGAEANELCNEAYKCKMWWKKKVTYPCCYSVNST
jgi:hypothetical protein